MSNTRPLPAPQASIAGAPNRFIPWQGGECPVDSETLVHLHLRCGWKIPDKIAGKYRWSHNDEVGDIVGYALAGKRK